MKHRPDTAPQETQPFQACCGPEKLATCCEPQEKNACCGSQSGPACGCQ